MWQKKTLTRGHIVVEGFSLGKFNVSLDCFCSRPMGTLVDSIWGNPNVKSTGNGVRCHEGKSPHHPLTKVPLLMGDLGPCLIHSCFGPPKSTSQMASQLV